MKTTPLTQGVSSLLLIVYILYGFFALPFAGFLLSLAVGLLSYGFLESPEMSVAFVILTGVVFSLISRAGAASALMKVATKEGFSPNSNGVVVNGNTDGSEKIAKRVERIYKANVGPHGVYASAFVEGFADASQTVDSQLEAVLKDKPAEESAESKPASATAASTAGSGIPPPAPPAVANKVQKAETQGGVVGPTTQGFRGAPDDGQFKLGVLPEETKGGYHIDTGTTVMNALNALKPDQIQAMSADTQKLIETQKSLMSMLSSMKPMLQDGKQMMDTFQQMFGNNQMKM
jgi:hypothetical protein